MICLALWNGHEKNPFFLRFSAGNLEKKGINIILHILEKRNGGEKKEKQSLQDKSYKLCKTRSNCLHQSFICALS